jgi:hypothetical protein
MIRLLLISLLFVYLTAQIKTVDNKEIFEQSKIKLNALLDPLEKIGEQIYREPRFYGADLWRYINGAAEAYHAYDFVALVLQRYKVGENELTVEIYDMGKPLNAFGIYAAERSPDLNYLKIGTQGYGDDLLLNFYQGPYYVKLSLDEPDQDKKLLREIAVTLANAMKEKSVIPAIYGNFPMEKRIAYTEQYLKKSVLGHHFLAPAYQVSYENGNENFKIIISQAKSATYTDDRFSKLKEYFRQSGTLMELTEMTFIGENENEDRMICSKQTKFIIILLNPPVNWQQWMDATRVNLKR